MKAAVVAVRRLRPPADVLAPEFDMLRTAADLAYQPDLNDPVADIEDWVEDACRIAGTIENYGLDGTWLGSRDRSDTARNLATGEVLPIKDLVSQGVDYLGLVPSAGHFTYPHIQFPSADNYWTLEAFARFAGRRFLEAGQYEDGDNILSLSVEEAAAELRPTPDAPLFVKAKDAKTFTGVWQHDETFDDMVENNGYSPWSTLHTMGMPAYIIQQHIPMTYEYRFFVIGHNVTTGAARIVEHSPIDNTGDRFCPLLRKHSEAHPDGPSPIKWDPDRTARLQTFAITVADHIKREAPQLVEYVLDVALTTNDTPVIVELNSIDNSGFYANDALAIFRARHNLRHPAFTSESE